MKRISLTLVTAFFLCAGTALAVPRYFVEDSSDVVKSFTIDDDVSAPAGETAVNASVIEAAYTGTIYQGGTWDGATYTPPVGIVTAIDGTTGAGSVQLAAHAMLDVFDQALNFIEANRHVWTQGTIENGIEGIHWQIINSARVALNSTRTHARRVKFCEEAASWPTDANGTVAGFLDAIEANDSFTLPTKDWSWVEAQDDPYTRTDTDGADAIFSNATNIESAPASSDLIGRGWVDDIP